MVKHIVMWQFASEAKGDIDAFKSMLLALNGKIPELLDIEVGENSFDESNNYDVVLISKFESFDALERYKVHPDHVKVVEFLKGKVAKRSAVDFAY